MRTASTIAAPEAGHVQLAAHRVGEVVQAAEHGGALAERLPVPAKRHHRGDAAGQGGDQVAIGAVQGRDRLDVQDAQELAVDPSAERRSRSTTSWSTAT